MAEEIRRKRGYDEEDDSYEPSGPLPPHQGDAYMQDQSNDQNYQYQSSNSNTNTNTNSNTNEGYPRHKHQRMARLPKGIELAKEITIELHNLGDSRFELERLLMQSSQTISFYWHEEEFQEAIIQYWGAMAVEMPHKSILLSALVQLCNAKNEKVGESFINWLAARINEFFGEISKDKMDIEEEENTPQDQILESKGWNRVKLLLRMLSLLTPIISNRGELINIFQKLIQSAVQLQEKNEFRSPLAELLLFEFSVSIPYLLVNDRNNEEMKNNCKELLDIAKTFTTKKTKFDEKIFKPILNDDELKCESYSKLINSAPSIVEEYLDDMEIFEDITALIEPLIKSVLEEKKLALEKDMIDEDSDEKIETLNSEVTEHQLEAFNIPSIEYLQLDENLAKVANDKPDSLWKYPRFMMDIFPNEKVRKALDFRTVPPVLSFTSMILHDIIQDLLFNLDYHRVTVSRQLLILNTFFNEKLFAKPNSPLDKLTIVNDLKSGLDFDFIKNLEENSEFPDDITNQMIESAKRIQFEFSEGYCSTWKMEEIVLETIINLMFALPTSSIPMVYYESMLMDTCGRDWTLVKRLSSSSSSSHSTENLIFSKILGDCFRYFYNNIEELDYENINKFINWFIFQISNYKFEWEWQEWVTDVLQLNEAIYHPKISFIRNVIHKEVLLSNAEYIRQKTLPPDFYKFVNLSLKGREELIKYDKQFFGESFAESNTQGFIEFEPTKDDDEEMDQSSNNNNNLDVYKLFSQYFFNHEDHPYHEICRDIYLNLEDISSSVESFANLIEVLKKKVETDESDVVENIDKYIVTLVVQSSCLIGSRSFSVFEESLLKVFGEKIKYVLEEVKDENKNKWLIDAVLRLWNNEPRIGLLFLERIKNYGLISSSELVESVFNSSDLKIVPLTEVYADEFLERLLFDEDSDEEVKNEVADQYFECIFQNINKLTEKVGEVDIEELKQLNEDSDDSKWALRSLLRLLKSKLRKLHDERELKNLKQLTLNVESDSIKQFLNGLINDFEDL